MMANLIRTDSGHIDFADLVKLLDTELAERDGNEHRFYSQFNRIDHIQWVVLAYVEEAVVGCGAIKAFDLRAVEVKRMYVKPEFRKWGIARTILTELENWAMELGYVRCVLETGKRQPEAIQFYEKTGYHLIDNYGQYIGLENSLCFEKQLREKMGGLQHLGL